MTDFIEVGKTGELADEAMKEVSAKRQNILLAFIGGKYYATTG